MHLLDTGSFFLFDSFSSEFKKTQKKPIKQNKQNTVVQILSSISNSILVKECNVQISISCFELNLLEMRIIVSCFNSHNRCKYIGYIFHSFPIVFRQSSRHNFSCLKLRFFKKYFNRRIGCEKCHV